MMSNAKRMRYVSENEYTSSEGEGFDDLDYSQQTRKNISSDRRSKSKGKWLSKNALMARENRLRKKAYMTNLEKEVRALKTENSNCNKVIENQSSLISDLKKEVKYLKSVIANSKDIGNLIKNIQSNTGMSVSTSLDQTLSLNDYVSKPKQPIARKTPHPWQDKPYPSFPTPESDLSGLAGFSNDILSDVQLDEFLGDDLIDPVAFEDNTDHLKEHDYTSIDDDEGDVGVCLHVSKHRVSLEFCSTCSDNASHSWN